MTEVINLSLSQKANHVVTHLYNNQESHIPYSKKSVVNYDNNVFLNTYKSGGHTNYSPRALIYDLKGGFGSLNKYEYHESKPKVDVSPGQIINVGETVPKNQFQVKLDQGSIVGNDLLNTSNTKYWSDYNKLIYSPRSLNSLTNYNYVENGPGVHKNFENLKFDNFRIGTQEFTNSPAESLEQLENFRFFLEKCDLFQGMNVVTDIDSAWGGYTNQLLVDLIDEYFNNGISNNKYNMWTFGLMCGDDINTTQRVSRIKTLVELSKNSTIMFPINQKIPQNSLLSDSFDNQSNWHASAVSSMFINSLWGLNNQNNFKISMSIIEDNILRGFENRKVVNEIKINKIDNLGTGMQDVSNAAINAYYGISEEPKVDDFIALSIPAMKPMGKKSKRKPKSEYLIKNNVLPQHSLGLRDILARVPETLNIYVHRNTKDIVEGDSFPSEILADGLSTKYYTEFNVSTSFREELKSYRKLIDNVRPNHQQYMDIIEDQGELVEDLSNMIEEYTAGYDESDELDDE